MPQNPKMGKEQTIARLKSSRANSKSCSTMSNVKGDSSTSLALLPTTSISLPLSLSGSLLVCSSPLQMFHFSGISNLWSLH